MPRAVTKLNHSPSVPLFVSRKRSYRKVATLYVPRLLMMLLAEDGFAAVTLVSMLLVLPRRNSTEIQPTQLQLNTLYSSLIFVRGESLPAELYLRLSPDYQDPQYRSERFQIQNQKQDLKSLLQRVVPAKVAFAPHICHYKHFPSLTFSSDSLRRYFRGVEG